MSMAKKDFIALADALRDVITVRNENSIVHNGAVMIPERDITEALVSFCRWQNGAFMEERWKRYLRGECGPNGGEVKKPKGVPMRSTRDLDRL